MPIRERLQQRQFHTLADEAVVSLMVAAEHFDQAIAPIWERHGITGDQYNVLRILRGAHPDPLPTLEIGERLIERMPGITRLLDRLEEKGLVRRERCSGDRRLVHCWITSAGLELLAAMDDDVDRADVEAVAELDAYDTAMLAALLERVRRGAER